MNRTCATSLGLSQRNFFMSSAVMPSPKWLFLLVGKITKWTAARYERFYLGEQCGTQGRIKTLAHFAREHQFASFVVAGQDRLERTRRGGDNRRGFV